ncbi:MAG: hypothetical protein ABIP45_04830 [Knoellia sp.]
MPDDCWGWIILRLYSLLGVLWGAAQPGTANSATRRADSGLAAAEKEETVPHNIEYAVCPPNRRHHLTIRTPLPAGARVEDTSTAAAD